MNGFPCFIAPLGFSLLTLSGTNWPILWCVDWDEIEWRVTQVTQVLWIKSTCHEAWSLVDCLAPVSKRERPSWLTPVFIDCYCKPGVGSPLARLAHTVACWLYSQNMGYLSNPLLFWLIFLTETDKIIPRLAHHLYSLTLHWAPIWLVTSLIGSTRMFSFN